MRIYPTPKLEGRGRVLSRIARGHTETLHNSGIIGRLKKYYSSITKYNNLVSQLGKLIFGTAVDHSYD